MKEEETSPFLENPDFKEDETNNNNDLDDTEASSTFKKFLGEEDIDNRVKEIVQEHHLNEKKTKFGKS